MSEAYVSVYTVMFTSYFNHVRLSLDNKRLLTYLLTYYQLIIREITFEPTQPLMTTVSQRYRRTDNFRVAIPRCAVRASRGQKLKTIRHI